MTAVRLFATGPLDALATGHRRALVERGVSQGADVRATVTRIVAAVRSQGDAALRALATQYDGVELRELEVGRAARRAALARVEPRIVAALERAARNIADVHAAFMPVASTVTTADGVVVTRRPDPLSRVGVYAPGGRAAYPSSVLMGAVPARVARVGEVILCSPPGADAQPSDLVLAAAEIAGVDRVFACGGAGAIAAMAYGTESMPRVDRIVGPGNAYVAEAKLQVVGAVAIDAPAGPSELLILTDGSMDPTRAAAEMIAQAEHDPHAACVAVSTDAPWAEAVVRALAVRVPAAARADIVTSALAERGAVLSARDAAAAIAFANSYAVEHLLLFVADEESWLRDLRNAGTMFTGPANSVAFGDYLTGANHVLPTGGLARSYSGLNILDFVRWTTCQQVDAATARRLAGDTACIADAEGLPGHADAARLAGQ